MTASNAALIPVTILPFPAIKMCKLLILLIFESLYASATESQPIAISALFMKMWWRDDEMIFMTFPQKSEEVLLGYVLRKGIINL